MKIKTKYTLLYRSFHLFVMQVAPAVVARMGPNCTLILGYFGISLFLAAHLYPTFEVLLPSYLAAGLCLGRSGDHKKISILFCPHPIEKCSNITQQLAFISLGSSKLQQ